MDARHKAGHDEEGFATGSRIGPLVRSCVEAETAMISVERLKQFTEIESEESEQYHAIWHRHRDIAQHGERLSRPG